MAIVEALTIRTAWAPCIPTISAPDLMDAIRVAERCGLSEFSSELWNQLRINVVSGGPPVTAQEIQTFRRVLRTGGAGITPPVEDELGKLEELDRLTRLGEKNRRPKRGRHVTEQNKRKIAAVVLLEECGYRRANSLTIVTTALDHHGVKMEADSLRKLLGNYETANERSGLPDAPTALSSLLNDCLFHLGWWLLWIGKNAGRRANAPDFCKRLLAEELHPHWERMKIEFSAISTRSDSTSPTPSPHLTMPVS